MTTILLTLSLALLPQAQPRYLPGEKLIYVRYEEGLMQGEWAEVDECHKGGRYRVKLSSFWGLVVSEKDLLTKQKFIERAKWYDGTGQYPSLIDGVPVVFTPPGDAPK